MPHFVIWHLRVCKCDWQDALGHCVPRACRSPLKIGSQHTMWCDILVTVALHMRLPARVGLRTPWQPSPLTSS